MKFTTFATISALAFAASAQPVLPTIDTASLPTIPTTDVVDPSTSAVSGSAENKAHGVRMTVINQSTAQLYTKKTVQDDFDSLPIGGTIEYSVPGGYGMNYALGVHIHNAPTPSFPQGAGNDTSISLVWVNEWIGRPYLTETWSNQNDPSFPSSNVDSERALSVNDCNDFATGGRKQLHYCRNDDFGDDGLKDLVVYVY